MKRSLIDLAIMFLGGLAIDFVLIDLKPQDFLSQQTKDMIDKVLHIISLLPFYALLLLVAVFSVGIVLLTLAALFEK